MVSAGECIGAVEAAIPPPEPDPTQAPPPSTDVKPKLTREERVEALNQRLDWTAIDALPPDLSRRARELIYEFHDIFSLDPMELGCCKLAKHKIVLEDDAIFQERYRKIPEKDLQEVRELLDDMLRQGAIVPSESPYRSAVVLAKKKDGKIRFCIDFRRLNKRTRRDAFPLPRIEETVNELAQAKVFSTVDLKWGFWQVEMDEDSRKYTAFTVGPMGFYECARMPFGLTNAPPTFQRAITAAMSGLTANKAYLDDVITFSGGDNYQEAHLMHLRKGFERYRKHNLKLKPEKCFFFQGFVDFLGVRVRDGVISPLQSNVDAVRDYPEPTNFTEIKGFLGMAGHYRRFIKDFAKKSKPLVELTAGENSTKKKELVELTPEAREAYQLLKKELIEAPVMHLPLPGVPYVLETDASGFAMGAVLSQRSPEDGKLHPVAYASKVLDAAQRRYHSTKQEFLAVKWALTEAFRSYLLGAQVEIWTDSNPLTYVLTTPNLDATGHRWVAGMALFDFSLKYRKGSTNVVADALSRPPSAKDLGEPVTLPQEAVAQLLDYVSRREIPATLGMNCLCVQRQAELDETSGSRLASEPSPGEDGDEPSSVVGESGDSTQTTALLVVTGRHPHAKWEIAQRSDPFLDAIHRYLSAGTDNLTPERFTELTGPDLTGTDPDLKGERAQYRQHRKKYTLMRGLIYKRHQPPSSLELHQLLLPKTGNYRTLAIKSCHHEAGHQGSERSLVLLSERFWWPGMARELQAAVAVCRRCQKFKQKPETAPLMPVHATYPLDLVHVDHLGLEREVDGDVKKKVRVQQVLVVTDHFTRYARAFCVPNRSALTTAKTLAREYFLVHGVPARLLSDQGGAFDNKLLAALCSFLNVKQLRTTAYHPQSNGQCERFNRTLIGMLGALEPGKRLTGRTT